MKLYKAHETQVKKIMKVESRNSNLTHKPR